MVIANPPLAEPATDPGGVINKPPFEMGVANLVACFIHASILLQFRPAVKGITCDFFGISLVGLGRA